MDELAMVRAELARLDEGERKLIRQLSDIRAAASAQKKRLDELIREREPPIQRLPVEILSTILQIALRGTKRSRNETLSRVSRSWRDIILDEPSFWSTIEIDGGRSLSHVREHLEKSREAPLNIIIRGELFDANDTIREGLDLLVPYAYRWQSLFIYTQTDIPRPVPQFILDCIGATKFPSLRYVDLNLRIRDNDLSPHPMPDASLSKYIPVSTLVKLSLSGDIPPCLLQPGSVHFPLLETLGMLVKDEAAFFKAVVTPKLKLLSYIVGWQDPPSVVFSGLRDKFCSVRQLAFATRSRLDTLDALALCRAFPGVCHAYFIHLSPLSVFFGQVEGTNGLESPADYWKSLESLVFEKIDLNVWLAPPIRERNAFVQWLAARHDPRPLRVHINNVEVRGKDVESFYMLCEILRENCVVELEGVRSWFESRLLMSAGSHLQLHVPMFTSSLVDDVGMVVGNIRKSR
ncbi:hypothetical protein PISMIDRAFT_683106 [Pisolithus microcarpus 441]|uniref:F-box domain-containing protein n=1 Tax=Pisolithus microcarpus 441 TaxID=765257 RepID=A0A0C9Y460_9AGAM|nr:hypothetical protein BKA83DRAFT_683106 [Pisolithus microcarpus]KIK19455.1 hypothetical protein PISMIDRAFT_683106 [Pisolithus microcarpus 441]